MFCVGWNLDLRLQLGCVFVIRGQTPNVTFTLAIDDGHELALGVDVDALDGAARLRDELLALVVLEVPAVDHTRVVSNKQFLLIRVQANGVDRSIRLKNSLTRKISHFKIPDSCGAILASGVHPFTVLLASDGHDVLGDALVVDDGVEVTRDEVVHPDVLIAPRHQHCTVGKDFHTVHL